MTSTTDELREALLLLEQRAPQMPPPAQFPARATATDRPRRWLLPLASGLIVCLIVTMVVVLIPLGTDHPAGIHTAPMATTSSSTATSCLQRAAYRPGADSTLVPGTPNALTICQYPAGTPQPTITTTSDTGAIVSALNALPTSPLAFDNGCRARFRGAMPARGTYELHFHYSSGPDVVVNVLPECRPSVNNSTSLQADGPTTVLALLSSMIDARLGWARACVPSTLGPVTLAFDGLTVAAARARAAHIGEVMDFLAADGSCDIGRIPITAGHTYIHAATADGRVVFARISGTSITTSPAVGAASTAPPTGSVASADYTGSGTAHGCGPSVDSIVTLTFNPDGPTPSLGCVQLRPDQRLRVVNNTAGFGQQGRTITVAMRGLPTISIARGRSYEYAKPISAYLAVGQHYGTWSSDPRGRFVLWVLS